MIFSSVLHTAVILLAVFGLPHLTNPPPVIEEPIPVELATLADKTNVPEPEHKPKPQPQKAALPLPPAPPLPEPPKAEPPPPKPEPPKAETPPPPPKPEPPQVAQLQPPPEPAPEPLPKPKSEVKPEPKPPQPQQVQAPQPPIPEPPKAKPKPPPDTTVEKILKSIEQSKPRPQPDQAQKVIKEVAQATPHPPASLDNRMTMSEIDAVREQIERCWNVPAGAKDAKDLVVDIHLTMNPDGTVSKAQIIDQARMQTDTFFRAAAESAYRAIFLCQPLHLPPEKFTLWQDMTLSFNPSEIL